jgi:hypothetical protein
VNESPYAIVFAKGKIEELTALEHSINTKRAGATEPLKITTYSRSESRATQEAGLIP